MPDGWFDAFIRPYYPERSEVPDIEQQHQRSLELLDRCEKQMRSNARYLRWFGWVPLLADLVRDADDNLRAAYERLKRVDAEMMRSA